MRNFNQIKPVVENMISNLRSVYGDSVMLEDATKILNTLSFPNGMGDLALSEVQYSTSAYFEGVILKKYKCPKKDDKWQAFIEENMPDAIHRKHEVVDACTKVLYPMFCIACSLFEKS